MQSWLQTKVVQLQKNRMECSEICVNCKSGECQNMEDYAIDIHTDILDDSDTGDFQQILINEVTTTDNEIENVDLDSIGLSDDELLVQIGDIDECDEKSHDLKKRRKSCSADKRPVGSNNNDR